jgi:hypothetical protein
MWTKIPPLAGFPNVTLQKRGVAKKVPKKVPETGNNEQNRAFAHNERDCE